MSLTLARAAGAAFYASFNEQCETCKGARERLHGFNLAIAGMIFYALMLILCVLKKRSLLTWGYGFATGIHLCLVTVLIMYFSETGGTAHYRHGNCARSSRWRCCFRVNVRIKR